ncbi:Os03g0178950 [Oryza sativa Japonica Group]|jgi:hypothetical protein|uniref:Os03g0178950 protein n=2 Tax=Oryza TaxID=4527 RepID=A0A0N7KGP6_ORYSJ|nr:Os03g0178950 [Oryza sativa Japonica Group]
MMIQTRLATAFRPPAWMLLEDKVHHAQCTNATTATATTSHGDVVEVSFCVDNPPAISCVHSPTLTAADFTAAPSVAC